MYRFMNSMISQPYGNLQMITLLKSNIRNIYDGHNMTLFTDSLNSWGSEHEILSIYTPNSQSRSVCIPPVFSMPPPYKLIVFLNNL